MKMKRRKGTRFLKMWVKNQNKLRAVKAFKRNSKKLKKIWKKLLKRYPQMLKNMKKTQKKLRRNGMAYYKKFKPLSKR